MKHIVVFLVLCLCIGGCSQGESSPVKESNGTMTASNKAEEWQVSPAFTIPKPGPDGKDVPYGLRGVNGTFAIVDGSVHVGTKNKQLVHVWGGTQEKTKQLFNKSVKVIGTNKESGKVVTAFENKLGVFDGDNNKPPYHYVQSVGYLELPSKGIWRLDASVENESFGSIVVEVQ